MVSSQTDKRAGGSDAHLLPRFRARAEMLNEQRKVLRVETARAVDEGLDVPLKLALTKPGDPRQLRGLPAIGRCVSGVSPGTDPVAELLRKEREREAA